MSEFEAAPEISEAAPEAEAAAVPQPPANPYAGTKHKVKIDNKELDVPYEQLVSDYQERAASQKRFQEAAKIKKEVDAFIGSLKSGDLKMLKNIIPPDQLRQFAEQELLDYVEYESLPEAEKRRMQAERERDEYKKQFESVKEAEQRQYMQQIEAQASQELDVEIGQAIRDLKASVGIDPKQPIEPWFVDHVARLMLAHLETDETAERMPAKVATERAWKGVENTVVSYLNSIPADKVIAMLPRSLRDAIRKADVGEAVTQLHQKSRTPGDEKPRMRSKERPTTDEFFSKLDQKFGLK
jgi:flagellar biosynthesis GTPase FlhF